MNTRLSRDEAKKQYGVLYSEVEAILFQHDPIGIGFADNTDEYAPEVSTILPRLKEAKDANDVLTIVHEEFTRWFSAEDAGPRDQYLEISVAIWAAWQRFSKYST